MGALAELLAGSGYRVRGSDAAAYPPMSTRLEEAGIRVHNGYDAAHLDPAPDVVIVGNAATPTHVEAAAARERGLPQLSLPEALAHFFLHDRRSLVVAGTHAKTTTTGLLAHILREAGHDPGFFVGGVLASTGETARKGAGPAFVVEGDEYDSAYFDKRPKMWLYRPHSAVVTSMEYDHADIYADWDDYRSAFETLAGIIPRDGLLALNADDPAVAALAAQAVARVRHYALDSPAYVTARSIEAGQGGQRFTLRIEGRDAADAFLPLGGRFNVANALAATTLALDEGVSPAVIAGALGTFRGMRRRQEVAGEAAGVLVIDDFAHHPTAVAATIEGVRERWPGRRVVAVFEPRSNSSRRRLFEQPYVTALARADGAFISAPPLRHNDDPADFLDPEAVASGLRASGVAASAFDSAAALLPSLLDELRGGDIALVMSNGSFDGLVSRLVGALGLEGHNA
jgi:UDP-N-acetylmuramate: L-alanyl-gamma-D-glutamyl-meso-diaminopimelate ligase